MLKYLTRQLLGLKPGQDPFDPTHLDDPVAMQTEWTPAKSGGANFRTHRLIEVNSNRMEFRATLGAVLFYLVFMLIGIGTAIGFFFSAGTSVDVHLIFPVSLGVIFAVIGAVLLYFGTMPVVFDRGKGAFWRGRKNPDQVIDKKALKHFCRLEDVHALQLVSEFISGKDTYYSYELNLGFKDGKRINVVDHGNPDRLRGDANTLSAFLNVPLWDAI